MSLNKVMLIGRLGKDPEIRYTSDQVAVATFPIATSEYYKSRSGEKIEKTEWHNIVCWRFLAELTEKLLKKGKLVFVEGKLQTRSWEDQSGNKRYVTEIVADNFQVLEKKDQTYDNSPSTSPKNSEEEGPGEEVPSAGEDDDLPF